MNYESDKYRIATYNDSVDKTSLFTFATLSERQEYEPQDYIGDLAAFNPVPYDGRVFFVWDTVIPYQLSTLAGFCVSVNDILGFTNGFPNTTGSSVTLTIHSASSLDTKIIVADAIFLPTGQIPGYYKFYTTVVGGPTFTPWIDPSTGVTPNFFYGGTAQENVILTTNNNPILTIHPSVGNNYLLPFNFNNDNYYTILEEGLYSIVVQTQIEFNGNGIGGIAICVDDVIQLVSQKNVLNAFEFYIIILNAYLYLSQTISVKVVVPSPTAKPTAWAEIFNNSTQQTIQITKLD